MCWVKTSTRECVQRTINKPSRPTRNRVTSVSVTVSDCISLANITEFSWEAILEIRWPKRDVCWGTEAACISYCRVGVIFFARGNRGWGEGVPRTGQVVEENRNSGETTLRSLDTCSRFQQNVASTRRYPRGIEPNKHVEHQRARG